MTEISPLTSWYLLVDQANEESTIDLNAVDMEAFATFDGAVNAAVESVGQRGGRRFVFILKPMRMIEASLPKVVDIYGKGD